MQATNAPTTTCGFLLLDMSPVGCLPLVVLPPSSFLDFSKQRGTKMPSCSLLRLTALSLIVAMVTACDALHANICDIYENQSLCNNKLHFEEIAQITTSPDITKRSFLGVLDGGYLISAEQTASINGYTYGKFTEWHLINKILSKSTACTHCPSTTFIIFENDDFYVSGNSFYRITRCV